MTHLFSTKKLIVILISVSTLMLLYILVFKNQKTSNQINLTQTSDEFHFPYELKNSDISYNLPNYLNEISGISYYQNDQLACIQDEKAQLYIFDTKKSKVIENYKYGKNGDFEGVTILKNSLYMLRSDGKIYSIENFKSSKYKKKSFETQLSTINDCEGLCYDSISNSLLIACKGKPYIDKKDSYKGFKAIYRFGLSKNKLKKKPFLLIDLNQILDLKKLNSYEKVSQKLAKELNESGDVRFQPSGIAIHPISGNIYVIASVGKSIIVLDRSGDIKFLAKLKKSLFQQPEGICFAPNGDLYISNEGKNGLATIVKFTYNAL